jgi:PadR family transcriptional regulator
VHAGESEDGPVDSADAAGLASGRDASGEPTHRGWTPLGGRRRWIEPFVLVLLEQPGAHGYAIMGELEAMGITSGALDVGQVYRTLRDLEAAGQVTSTWSTDPVGPQRREYQLTDAGWAALDEWAAVMRDRARLIGVFEKRYRARKAARADSRRRS